MLWLSEAALERALGFPRFSGAATCAARASTDRRTVRKILLAHQDLADADCVRPLHDRMTVGRRLPKERMGRRELSISAALVRRLDEGRRQAVRCDRCTETRLARPPATHSSH